MTVEPVQAPTLRSTVLNNAAVAITAGASFLTFIGISYNEALFAPFGLKPSVVTVDRPEVISNGFLAAFWALLQVASDNLVKFGILLTAVILAGVITFLLIRHFDPSMRIAKKLEPLSPGFEIANKALLKWSIVAFAIATGVGAGNHAGKIDSQVIERRRDKPTLCYVTDHGTYPSTLLAQDRDRLVLVGPRATRVIAASTLQSVVLCRDLTKSKPTRPNLPVEAGAKPNR